MAIGLGIDAGGTYTDVVVYDLDSGRLLDKAKALTTHHDYSEGIAAAMDRVEGGLLGRARLVGLSTTLATNALVEGRGGVVGLVLLGYPDHTADQVRHRPVARVPGAMSIKGEPLEPLDEELFAEAVRTFRDEEGVEALAISGFSAIMNPAHEIRAAEIAADMTDLPLVLGHQLSQKLNAIHRATTAALNARLVPLVARLLSSVREVLEARGLLVANSGAAPIMVVKSDGTLMAEAVARARPIETILSGPAASVMGALHLAGRDDALVLDMGGTTLDMALVRDGKPRYTPTGASIGEHQTHVASIDIRTVGLGGDSYVRVERGQVAIGPRRVVPLSLLADQHPGVVDDLTEMASNGHFISPLHQPADLFVRTRNDDGNHLDKRERLVLEALRDGPLTRAELARRVGAVHPSLLQTDRLERGAWIARAALTPTDCLHVLGDHEPWNVRAAQLGATLYAARLGRDVRDFCRDIVERVCSLLAEQCLATALTQDGVDPSELMANGPCRELLSRGIEGGNGGSGVGVRLSMRKPLIAIGAPVGAYVPKGAGAIGAECIIPPDADVANAIGAVVGRVIVRREATIARAGYKKYACHADDGRFILPTLEEAKDFARDHLSGNVREAAERAGASEPEVKVEVRDRYADGIGSDGSLVRVFLESVMTATAEGRPVGASAGRETKE